MSIQQIDGYRVSKARNNDEIPYQLFGPRGAHYGLMRNQKNPEMMFVINMRRFGVIDRMGWFTDRNGKLERA